MLRKPESRMLWSGFALSFLTIALMAAAPVSLTNVGQLTEWHNLAWDAPTPIDTPAPGQSTALPTGACCIFGNVFPPLCVELTEADCLSNGGRFRGVGTNCVTTRCFIVIPLRGCCVSRGGFTTCINVANEAECLAQGGVFVGLPCSIVLCAPITTDGACCISSTATCIVTSAEKCASVNGEFHGPGSTCSPLPCTEF